MKDLGPAGRAREDALERLDAADKEIVEGRLRAIEGGVLCRSGAGLT